VVHTGCCLVPHDARTYKHGSTAVQLLSISAVLGGEGSKIRRRRTQSTETLLIVRTAVEAASDFEVEHDLNTEQDCFYCIADWGLRAALQLALCSHVVFAGLTWSALTRTRCSTILQEASRSLAVTHRERAFAAAAAKQTHLQHQTLSVWIEPVSPRRTKAASVLQD